MAAAAGTLRHAALTCTHPALVRVRESMFDAVETLLAAALTAGGGPLARRTDSCSAAVWVPGSGARSQDRWPLLSPTRMGRTLQILCYDI